MRAFLARFRGLLPPGGSVKRFVLKFGDDFLLLAGCACILRGLGMWSGVITWIAAGIMLIGYAVLIGKAKANDDTE